MGSRTSSRVMMSVMGSRQRGGKWAVHASSRLLLLALGSLYLGTAHAAPAIPQETETKFLLQALMYERNLHTRTPDAVKILVVYSEAHPPSKTKAERIAASAKAEVSTIAGLPVEISMASADDRAAFERNLGGVSAFYLSTGLSDQMEWLRSAARSRRITTMSGDPEIADEHVALGVLVYKDQPRLLVNLPRAKEEGADFLSGLFRIALVKK